MTNAQLYNLLRVAAGLLTVASAMIAVASNLPDLGLSKHGIALLTVVQAGISATLAFLPQLTHPPGDVRGEPGH